MYCQTHNFWKLLLTLEFLNPKWSKNFVGTIFILQLFENLVPSYFCFVDARKCYTDEKILQLNEKTLSLILLFFIFISL